MIAAWMLYAIIVGSLLGAGALTLERILRTHGLPSRWIWVGAMAFSIGWPAGHWVWQNRALEPPPMALEALESPVSAALPMAVLPLDPVVLEVSSGSVLRLLDGPILVAWAGTSGILLLFFTFLLLRTHSLRVRWRREGALGQNVLISEEWGPAVVGFLRPQIVLPSWCREIDEWALRFIIDHEVEHIRAGDLRLTLLAGIVPVLFPWNLPIWWQLARLRTAVEGDCDLRVLEKNPGQTRPYLDLLLEVGERSSRRRPLAAMLSEPYETLKLRIRIMTMPFPKRPWIRGGILGASGGLLVVVACLAPGPTDARNGANSPSVESRIAEPPISGQELWVPPTFTPFIVNPSVRNREEVATSLAETFPTLEGEKIAGTVDVWFFIDEEGTVQRTLVNQSSGYRALDEAAIRVANLIEFFPALNRDQPRPVWVSLPIEFTTDADRGVQGPRERSRAGTGGNRAFTGPSPAGDADLLPRGEIAGTTTDAATGQPLGGVQLFVRGTRVGTLSNQDGRFLIEHVPVGTREVVAQLVGFGAVRIEVSVVEEDRAEADFGLRLEAIELAPLVVGGSRSGG